MGRHGDTGMRSAVRAIVGRFLARLVPAGRREWVRAAWAESQEMAPGRRRLTWQAGTVWLAARQLVSARDGARGLSFMAAAVVVAWLSWPGSPANFTTLVDRVDAVVVAVLLAAMALFARRRFGPVRDGWVPRALRISGYAAILAIMPAKAAVEQFTYTVPSGGERLRLYSIAGVFGSGGANWVAEIIFLLIMAGYAVTVLWMTSARSAMAGSTLATGAIGGMVIGAVMYLAAPLGGLGKHPTSPWFSESSMALLTIGAWVVLLATPALTALLAARRCPAPSGSANAVVIKQRQGLVAGTLATLAGALIVTLAGTGTIALMVKSAAVRTWLLHGQHLTGNALYARELNAGANAVLYFLMCLTFPVVGLLCSVMGAGFTGDYHATSEPDDGPPSDGGPQPTGPTPRPVVAGRCP